MFQDPDQSDLLVPTLLQLTIERIAELMKKYKLPISGSVITGDLTNQVIEELCRNRSLNFRIMKRILTSNQFVVDTIYLKDIDFNLEMCFKHNLLSFWMGDLHATSNCRKLFVNRVLEAALNETSLKQLKNLDLSGDKPLNQMWPIFVAKNLRALECLSFANRVTTERTWARFKGNFSQLRCLNISNTGITDIRCISGLRNLEVLIMHDLNIKKGNIDVLTHLKKLKVLDISRSTGDGVDETTDAHLDLVHGIYGKSVNAIENGTTTPWPVLQALDISGLHFSQQGIDQAIALVEKIVRAHPNLTEIGLLETQLNFVDVQVPGRHLQVFNEASRKSLLTSLSHYKNLNHPAFIWSLLLSIETKLQTEYAEFSAEELKTCLDVVCLTLHRHQIYPDIQHTGISCLHELSDDERTRSLSVTEVKSIIDVCLDVIDMHNHLVFDDQICSTRRCVFSIFWNFWHKGLVDTNRINHCWIVRSSLTTMMLTEDAEVDRAIMYTLSIVTPKLERSEKEELSRDGEYVKQLVNKMVVLKAKCREATDEDGKRNATDVLNYTLTTLWELQNIPAFQDSDVRTEMLQILNDLTKNTLVLQQLCKSEIIASLLSFFDGNINQAIVFVEQIVQTHPKLAEIGLLETVLNYINVQVPDQDLQVFNEVSGKLLVTALSHLKNLNHPTFVWIIMMLIERKLETEYAEFFPGDLKECLHNVCQSMHQYPEYANIQHTGISCLYELCELKRTKHLSETEVRSIIHVCLDVLDYQNQSSNLNSHDDEVGSTRYNVFAIFWNFWDKKVAVTDEIDLYRIVTIGFNTMLLNAADAEIDKLIMYTMSIVTPQLKESKKEELSRNGEYVKQLVNKIVVLEAKFREATVEDEKRNATAVLKYTLTTLLELKNIPAFLEADGITLAIRVLTTFQDCLVQTKTLGILRRIAVNSLEGQQFCKSENISVLITCLDGDFQEMDSKKLRETVARSHKASFVLAHLLLHADDIWQCSMQRKIVCQKLLETTARYPKNEDRSAFTFESDEAFDAFHSMICISKSNGAGMLILWTVLHLLMTDDVKTPEGLGRYMDMFLSSDLCPMVEKFADGVSEHIQDLDNRVVLLAKKLLEFVDAHNIEN